MVCGATLVTRSLLVEVVVSVLEVATDPARMHSLQHDHHCLWTLEGSGHRGRQWPSRRDGAAAVAAQGDQQHGPLPAATR